MMYTSYGEIMLDYSVATDIALVKDLLDSTTGDVARAVGVGSATLERWQAGSVAPSPSRLAAFYDYAFSEGLRLNSIKAQLHREEIEAAGHIVLFHGSKAGIEGSLSLEKSRPNNDFGRGFYCGESMDQAITFVADHPASSLYIVGLDPAGLRSERFHVDEDWMLAVAWFRGRLSAYGGHPRVEAVRRRVGAADFVIAPIADNRMFEIIDSFADGDITDLQCRHSLAATNLGNQYAFVSQGALDRVSLIEHCFLCPVEKRRYLEAKRDDVKAGVDKAKAARRQFRGQGRYIEEVLS